VKTILVISFILLLHSGCTTYQTISLTKWLRISSADEKTIIPHIWYVGESWGKIEIKKGMEWEEVERWGKSGFRLYAYQEGASVLAVEDEWGGPSLRATIYRQDGTSVKVKTTTSFLQALPLPNKFVAVVQLNTDNKNIHPIHLFDTNGNQASRSFFKIPKESDSVLMIGFCGNSPVFQNYAGEKWEMLEDQPSQILGKDSDCFKQPKCISYASKCEFD